MRKYNSLLLIFGVVALSSCLKQNTKLDPKQSNNVLEIYESVPVPTTSPADAVYTVYAQSFDIAPSIEFKVDVSYSGADVAPEDIQITLGLEEPAMTDYNAEQGTSYVFIPQNVFTVDSWNLTIPKGQRIASMTVTFNTTLFNPSLTYGFPVKIKSASMGKISSNFGTVIYALGAKNKYDGVYRLRSTQLDWAAFNIGNHNWEWPNPDGIYMITSGGSSVNMWDNWGFHTYIHPAVQPNMTTATGFGSTNPRFVFDPSTNAMTNAVNDFPSPPNGRTFAMNPAVTNSRYDPADGTIYAAILLKQPGRPDLQIFDTLYYEGPRP